MDALLIYIEVNVVCAIILLMVLLKAASNIGYVGLQRVFASMIFLGISFFVFDVLWLLLDHGVLQLGSATLPVNYVVRSLYWLSTVALAYMAFCYFELNQQSELVSTRARIWVLAIPLLVEVFLCLVNPLTGWLFTVGLSGEYARGPLFPLQVVILLGYLFASVIRAIIAYRKQSNYAERDRLRSYAWFSFPVILGAVLQMFVWNLPLASAGIALAVLNLSLDTLRHLVSLDALTQLNNRNQFLRSLTARLADERRAPSTYLLIIDLDLFKQVNDTYGHAEGDRALQCVAEAMRQAIGTDDTSLLGRFGGDEFLASVEAGSQSEVDAICRSLSREVGVQAHKAGLPCPIEVSIGYAKWQPTCSTVQQMLEEADKALYEQKTHRAAQRAQSQDPA